ncbi:MAG: hypothetical protein WC831_04570 [Parcubacteria group bacterium]|jgi:uncharacterized membrane protein YjgN (DUF898 family)
MNKIKSVIRKIGIGAVVIPFTALAQFQPPSGTNLPQSSIYDIIRGVMMWVLGLLGFFAVIGFVISGIMYLVAAGDEDSQKKAKKAMYYSITGVIVGLVGLVVIYAVNKLLGTTSTQF